MNNQEKQQVLKQKLEQQKQQEYQKQVKQYAPKQPVLKNSVWAFIIGGLICAIAQILSMGYQSAGLMEKPANTATLVTMIFIGALLTGIGVYDNLVKIGGAGSIIPITGFANSIVSPAMEFKREGFVYGLGAKMFTVAGPVLVYGFITSVFIGLIAFVLV